MPFNEIPKPRLIKAIVCQWKIATKLPLGEKMRRGKNQRAGANNEHARSNIFGLGGHFTASKIGEWNDCDE